GKAPFLPANKTDGPVDGSNGLVLDEAEELRVRGRDNLDVAEDDLDHGPISIDRGRQRNPGNVAGANQDTLKSVELLVERKARPEHVRSLVGLWIELDLQRNTASRGVDPVCPATGLRGDDESHDEIAVENGLSVEFSDPERTLLDLVEQPVEF